MGPNLAILKRGLKGERKNSIKHTCLNGKTTGKVVSLAPRASVTTLMALAA